MRSTVAPSGPPHRGRALLNREGRLQRARTLTAAIRRRVALAALVAGGAACSESAAPVDGAASVVASGATAPSAPDAASASSTPSGFAAPSGSAVPSSAPAPSGSASASATGSPALAEHEDIPLAKPCRFRVARPDPTDLSPDPAPDVEWRAKRGQRFITCRFRVGKALAPVEVKIETSPGSHGIDAMVIRSADDSIREARFGGGLTGPLNASQWEVEATDANFDGITDFAILHAHGTMGCTYYRHFVFVPDDGDRTHGKYVDARTEWICNPKLDAKRKLLTGWNPEPSRDVVQRWDKDRFVDVTP